MAERNYRAEKRSNGSWSIVDCATGQSAVADLRLDDLVAFDTIEGLAEVLELAFAHVESTVGLPSRRRCNA